MAIRYPTCEALKDALQRLRAIDWPIRQATDHGPHLSIYLADPDGNGLELQWDRPLSEWPRDSHGHLAGRGEDYDEPEALFRD